MRSQEKPEIRRLPLFREMATPTFDALMQAAYAQTFPPQLDLLKQGEPADFLHIVVKGAVELHSDWNDRRTTMAVVRPISTFILAACIKDAPYLMSARTLEESRIIMVPSVDLRVAIRRDPVFAMAVIMELAGCYRSIVRHAKNLKLRTSRERLAAYIIRQSKLSGGGASFVLPVEKWLLASYLGMTPENLSRTMKTLKDDGVMVDGTRVTITDRAKLLALGGPDLLLDGPDPDGATSGVSLPQTDGRQRSDP